MDIEKLRYPLGKFHRPNEVTNELVKEWIEELQKFPKNIRDVVSDLSDEQLTLTYREGAWNIRQLVHHIADSHMNVLIRFKMALTEEVPTINSFSENKWATLPDSTEADIKDSLNIIEGVHARLVLLIQNLSEDQLKREFGHPQYDRNLVIGSNMALYAWHGKHHLEHIKIALKA